MLSRGLMDWDDELGFDQGSVGCECLVRDL